MEKKFVPNIVLQDCKIKFRNFRGEASKYNRAGDRNFHVILPNEEFALKLQEDGWNVKAKTREIDGEEVTEWTLPVAVAYYNSRGEKVRNPPRIYTYAGGIKTELGENEVKLIDSAQIKSVDLTIRPYCWENERGNGVKAYLKNMYVTLVVDELEEKWRHIGEDDDEEENADEIPF